MSARRVGHLLLGDAPVREPAESVAVQACVSLAHQPTDLDRQVARATAWAAQRLAVSRVVTEVRSALDGQHRQLLAFLRDGSVSTIVVEHRDRFCRFGGEYVEAALAARGRRLLVVDPSEVGDDLVRDVAEILTALCTRLYGRKAAAKRVARVIAAATEGREVRVQPA